MTYEAIHSETYREQPESYDTLDEAMGVAALMLEDGRSGVEVVKRDASGDLMRLSDAERTRVDAYLRERLDSEPVYDLAR